MAQSSGGGSLVKWGLVALVAWYVYENYFASASAAAPSTPTTPTSPTSPTAPVVSPGPTTTSTTPAAPAASKYPPLSFVKSLTLSIANQDNQKQIAACGDQPAANIQIAGFPSLNPDYVNWLSCRGTAQPMFTPDAWNTYLVRAGGPNPAPDPAVVFPGVDRTQTMSFDTYWAAMGPALAVQGLSGYFDWLRRGRR